MTEREGGPTRVEDIRLFNYLKEKESSRDGKDAELHDDEVRNSLILTRDLPVDDDHVVDENTTQIVLEGEDGEDIDVPLEVSLAEDG